MRLVAFVVLFIAVPKISAAGCIRDSIQHYRNGKDSVRLIYKNDRIYKRISYFPNGKTQTLITTLQYKESNSYIKRRSKLKYESWNETGKKIEKERSKEESWNWRK
jgi:hypothetical protein